MVRPQDSRASARARQTSILAANGAGPFVWAAMLCAAALANDSPLDDAGLRPQSWAEPVEVAGVPNLYKISPDFYRSGQPRGNSLEGLSLLGVKTIVSLRVFRFGAARAHDAGFQYAHIPMTAWNPQREDVVEFLRVVTDSRLAPVLVHCRRGADRTGFMVAIYRVAVQGWSKTRAIEEMTQGGFGFNASWSGLIEFIDRLDIDAVRREAGIQRYREARP